MTGARRHTTYNRVVPRKPPPIVIPRGKLRPTQRAPIIQTRVVQDKRQRVGRKAKHKKRDPAM